MHECERSQCAVLVENCAALRRKHLGAKKRRAVFRDEGGNVNTEGTKKPLSAVGLFKVYYWPPGNIL